MTEEAKKKIENVYRYSNNSIEKIEAAKFGYSLAEQEIERLKGLIEKAYGTGVSNVINPVADWDWPLFKLKHNL